MNYLQILSFVVGLIALVCAIVSISYYLKLRRLAKDFFAGKQAASLEDFIINQNKKINELSSQSIYIEEAVKLLRDQQKLSIQKIGLHRYNPFSDDGGNLSFSIALLDEHQNGVVITSMHAREQNRIYAKPISAGKSDYTLTQEETKAITESRNF